GTVPSSVFVTIPGLQRIIPRWRASCCAAPGTRVSPLGRSQPPLRPREGILQVVHEARIVDAGEQPLAVAGDRVDLLMERLQRVIEQRRTIAVELRVSAPVDERD